MSNVFPAGLPCPQIDDYAVTVHYGLRSVRFEAGNTRQRKTHKSEVRFFAMSLVLSIPQLYTWQSWANKFGYDWHFCNLLSDYSGFTSDELIPHYIRYISDIDIQPVDADYVRVSVQAEMDVNTLPQGVITPSGHWYVARTPANPANAGWLIAKTPAAPANAGWIIAGTPTLPAA